MNWEMSWRQKVNTPTTFCDIPVAFDYNLAGILPDGWPLELIHVAQIFITGYEQSPMLHRLEGLHAQILQRCFVYKEAILTGPEIIVN